VVVAVVGVEDDGGRDRCIDVLEAGWKRGSFGVRAAVAARFPPAELPATTRVDGSAP
jgi:hypothetical protein